MEMKNWLLVGIVLFVMTAFIVALSSGLFSQSVVGGQSTQLKCESYLRNTYCVQSSTSPAMACTPCSLQSLGYSVVIDGVTTNKLWKADCVPISQKDASHNFCGATASAEKVKLCIDSTHLSQDVVQGDMGSIQYNDIISCPSGCAKGTNGLGDYCKEALVSSPTISCLNKCNSASQIKCTGSGYVTCQRQSNGCLDWSTTIGYCPSGKECNSGSCVTIPVAPVVSEPVEETCDASTICTGTYTYEKTTSDCTVTSKTCASGTKCSGGKCVSIPPVPPVVNLCEGVTCSDGCTATYDYQSAGVCNPESGKCTYTIETLSSKCLPAPVNNTAPVVVIRQSTEKTWVEKYGLIILGVVIVVLVFLYINMSTKGKKGKRR